MDQKSFWTGVATGGGVVAVIAAVVLVLGPGQSSDSAAEPTVNLTAASADPAASAGADATQTQAASVHASTFARQDPNDPLAIGDIEAPVVMIEWADLRCHYCGVFAQETLPALISDYVDAGLLRIEWHSAPVLGGTSTDAAVAARAAGEQGLFWEFIEAVYAENPTGATEWTQDALVDVASGIAGLDVAAFAAALSDETLIAAEAAEAAQSTNYGITGTPMFIINDEVKRGAAPLADFASVIDAQLGK